MVVFFILLLVAGPALADETGQRDAIATAWALSTAFADVAERVAPATVHVQAEKSRAMSSGLQQLMRDYSLPGPETSGPAGNRSTGSGVIVRSDGLVLTNHHVINGAVDIQVTLYDKRQFSARVVGSDPRTDIAVLQIEADEIFPTAPIGDSDAVRVGHWVLAIGHPFDFQFSVSAGIVSARGRRNLAPEEIQDYIQTDAAVNPGSSGGPLFNLDGEVIGINTAIYTPSGGSAQNSGISFAIPSNMAWRVGSQLLETGRVARAGMGLTTRDSPASADDPRPGAEVTRVVPGGPAEVAGIRRGDVIIAVDGEAIGSSDDLRGIVLAAGPHRDLLLTFERSGAVDTAVCGTLDGRVIGAVDIVIPADALEWGGMILVSPDMEWTTRFGVVPPDRDGVGLFVISVEPDSPGAQAGLEIGDLVVEVQRREIGNAAEFLERVEGRRAAMLTFWRGEGYAVAAVAGL